MADTPETKGNVSEKGRYDAAPADKPHMQPEIAPLRRDAISADLPPTLAGALPENRGREEKLDEDKAEGE